MATSLTAQDTEKGIDFFNGNWKALVKEAKATNKMIFVDVYTDWCAPCKYMDKQIFTQAQVGDSMNKAFISYRLNAEEGEGIALAGKFGVNAYPSFLFLTSSGNLVYKAVGEREVSPFLQLAVDAAAAAADENNPGVLEQQFEEGNRESDFLIKYLGVLKRNNLPTGEALDAYFHTLSAAEMNTESTWIFIGEHINGTSSAAVDNFVRRYPALSATAKKAVHQNIFNVLIRNGAGAALKQKRLIEYSALRNFATQMDSLSKNESALLTRLDLIYGEAIRNYVLVKKAGYQIAANAEKVSVASAKIEDKRQFDEIMKPFRTGQQDSTKTPGFEEEKKYLAKLYSAELAEQLYTAAKAFATLPLSETGALKDAYRWATKGSELLPENQPLKDLQHELRKLLAL